MTDEQWLSVVEETARDLDGLGFIGGVNKAQAALRAAGKGRAREVVLGAVKLRAGGTPRRCPGSLVTDRERWALRVRDLTAELAEAQRRLEAHSTDPLT